MAFSYYTYTGDGTTTQFPVAFGYIRREHVLATVAGASATFTFVNSTTIQMDAPPANGAVVRVYRQTPLTAPLVNFTDGSTLVAADLDTNALQSIYTQQELDDSLVDGLAEVIPNGDKGDITTSVGGSVWTIDNGAVTTAKLASVIAPTVSSLNGGPLAGTRNRIINGNFDFWQRGTSFTLSTSFQYTADRWRAKVGTGGAGSIVRNISATNNPYLTLAITTAGTGSHELGQPIEFVRSVTGDSGASTSVSVSFKLAITSGTGTVAVSLLQYFGSGGSPSGGVSLSLGTITPTGTATRYTLSGTLASIAGKTFGTNNDDQLVLIFTPSNAVATYDFAAIQLEPGTVATPFEHRSYGQELALCQRYYYQPGSSYTEQSYGTGAGANTFTQIYFPTQMRANPTITAAWSGGVNAVGSAITALGAIGATATLASFAGGDFAAVITWTSFSAEL